MTTQELQGVNWDSLRLDIEKLTATVPLTLGEHPSDEIRPYIVAAIRKNPLLDDEARFVWDLKDELEAYSTAAAQGGSAEPRTPLPISIPSIFKLLLAVCEVYEYESSKGWRAKVGGRFAGYELRVSAERDREMGKWTQGKPREPGRDDKEIHRDAAFEESDKDRSAGPKEVLQEEKRAAKRPGNVRLASVDRNVDAVDAPAHEGTSEDEYGDPSEL
ncbi:hypothetical protein EYR40_003239 [Pleurotus pulmonarius]|nr:hypothetical protein EYR40_003239 [Pleurotus pulmonarius]